MLRSLYIAGTGMIAQRSRMDVITNNIANVETVGYKKDEMLTRSFADMLIDRMNDPTKSSNRVGPLKAGTHIDDVATYFTQGTLEPTEEPTDMALSGDGFFVVQTPQGDRYTRAGNFAINADGKLVNADGYFVMGQSGPITVKSTDFFVDEAGNIAEKGASVGKLRIVRFNDTKTLKKIGDGLYEGTGATAVKDGAVSVRQGMIELSNVDIAREMVDMITTNRAFEINQRVVKMIDSTLDKTVNDIARF